MTTPRLISASELEQATGLDRGLLRTWRQRYGFPAAARQNDGTQAYPSEQIQQLLLIKQLRQAGLMAGQIVGKPLTDLAQLVLTVGCEDLSPPLSPAICKAIDRLKQHDLEGLEKLLEQERQRLSRCDLIEQIVAPLVVAVGNAWRCGDINVFEEHLSTVILMRLLFAEIAAATPKAGYPRILVATPPDEAHVLGLLMAQVVLADCGATSISLGAGASVEELSLAARACAANIVALSVSAAYPKRRIRPMLIQLRALLPDSVPIWIGGAGVSRHRHSPDKVCFLSDLTQAKMAFLDFVKKSQH